MAWGACQSISTADLKCPFYTAECGDGDACVLVQILAYLEPNQ